MKTKFETPGQRQMWLDAIINIKVEPLPSEYDSETWDDIPSDDATLSDEELEAISAEVSDEELDEAVLTEDPTFTYDPDLKAIKMEENGLVAHGLYNTEYEDLFYKVWIEENGQIVYQNDYGKEKFNSDHISDDTIDGVLDNLVTYAMEVDSNLHESFEIIEEETLEEDFSNINMLQGLKGKSVTLKLKDGSSIDVASDEAKIIAKRYEELKGDLQKKFADLLNKSQMSFLIAYKDAMK